MAETIYELFQKYAESVGPALEEDRYFQYLYESIQAADKTIEQKSQVLHKVVDEAWLSTVEDSLDAINTIIDKPRRTLTRAEELVPVSLAKKITADSVRHLSMNTQFINSNEAGEIQPSKVLNVTNEDSYDLYENRFIYHLIQRLVTFIDKRTDVIFWSTGDETRNVMQFETRVDDAYEQIEYKVEMKITNRQSFAENDADNMSVFMRIDRVRRLVMAMRTSSFCSLMAGCAKVRSPIQRTNLMMKDPDYRKCYALWQFLERYDEVGYSIVEQDRAYEIDEEYLIQLYTQMITAYSLFKTLTGEDKRDVDRVIDEKRKFHKPKFIKKIREEFVENKDMEDVEVRRIFLEEVTQAQLDAEAALAAEQETTAQLMDQLEDLNRQMEKARVMREDAEAALQIAEMQKNEAVEASQKAREDAQKAIDDAAQRIAQESRNAAQRIAEAQSLQKAAETERDDANGAKVAAESLKFAAEQRAAEAEEAMQLAVAASERAVRECDEKIAEAKNAADARADEAVRAAEARAEAAESSASARALQAEDQAAARISAAEQAAAEKVAAALAAQQAAEALQADAEKASAEALNARQLAEEASRQAEANQHAAELRSAEDNQARSAAESARSEMEAEKNAAISAMEAAREEAAQAMQEAERILAEAQSIRTEAEDRIAESKEAMNKAGAMMSEAQQLSRESKQTAEDALRAQAAAEKAEKKALSRLEKETRARIRAQEKAKEGTLSKYLADLLSGRGAQNKRAPEKPEEQAPEEDNKEE